MRSILTRTSIRLADRSQPHRVSLAVAQDASGTDDKVVHPCCDDVHLRRSDKDAEGIVLVRDGPRPVSRLGQVHFVAPVGHDDVIVVSARSRKAQTLPKRDSRGKVAARGGSSTKNCAKRMRESASIQTRWCGSSRCELLSSQSAEY